MAAFIRTPRDLLHAFPADAASHLGAWPPAGAGCADVAAASAQVLLGAHSRGASVPTAAKAFAAALATAGMGAAA